MDPKRSHRSLVYIFLLNLFNKLSTLVQSEAPIWSIQLQWPETTLLWYKTLWLPLNKNMRFLWKKFLFSFGELLITFHNDYNVACWVFICWDIFHFLVFNEVRINILLSRGLISYPDPCVLLLRMLIRRDSSGYEIGRGHAWPTAQVKCEVVWQYSVGNAYSIPSDCWQNKISSRYLYKIHRPADVNMSPRVFIKLRATRFKRILYIPISKHTLIKYTSWSVSYLQTKSWTFQYLAFPANRPQK